VVWSSLTRSRCAAGCGPLPPARCARRRLGEELAGSYLSGSLALGGFHPPSSDIDVLVATAVMPNEAAIQRLAALHATRTAAGGWTARLEVMYLPVAALRRYDPSDQCATQSRPATGPSPLAGRAQPGCWTAGSPEVVPSVVGFGWGLVMDHMVRR
jgi:hypothetical protein